MAVTAALAVPVLVGQPADMAASVESVSQPAVATERAVRFPTASGVASDVRASTTYPIDCGRSEADVSSAGGPRVRFGSATIYAGTAQVSADNKDPRLIRFDSGVESWCRTDIETTGDDGQGYGLLWDGSDRLYAVFSATGTQGSADQDLRRVAIDGWLRSYADASSGGGGPKVSVVARLDPATGAPLAATFMTALRSGGQVNSFDVTSLDFTDAGIEVGGRSFFSPRRADRSAMTCSGSSPFAVTHRLTADLDAALEATATRCR